MTSNQIANDFIFVNEYFTQRKHKLKQSLYKKITKASLPLFFRGADIISIDPLVNGVYEIEIQKLMEHFGSSGYGDFLIDVGANIGLSSCQSGNAFKEVHMFEPNPLAISILKVNANIALRDSKYHIHEFGLGHKSEILKLYVPFDNWGGAFIKSNENEYTEDLLSSKDGYGNFNIKNYDLIDVKIESSTEQFRGLFNQLKSNGLSHGVIKIDVEGYEKLVIESILDTIISGISVFIIFENWKEGLDFSKLSSHKNLNLNVFKLFQNKTTYKSAPRWVNSLLNFLKGGFTTKLSGTDSILSSGTYVLHVQNH